MTLTLTFGKTYDAIDGQRSSSNCRCHPDLRIVWSSPGVAIITSVSKCAYGNSLLISYDACKLYQSTYYLIAQILPEYVG
jgi:hypothetical protein